MEKIDEEIKKEMLGMAERLMKACSGNITFNDNASLVRMDIKGNYYAGDHIDNGGGKEKSKDLSTEKIHEAIMELLDARDDDGRIIFREQQQWYAVYKVLNECCDFPKEMSEFAKRMNEWGMGKVSPSCNYDSIRAVVAGGGKLTSHPVKEWHLYASSADTREKKQIVVAERLMAML